MFCRYIFCFDYHFVDSSQTYMWLKMLSLGPSILFFTANFFVLTVMLNIQIGDYDNRSK